MVHRRRQRGLVLLIVLWTIAILLILAATTRQTSGLDTKLSVFTTQEMRCKWAARAGVEKAVAILNEDDRTTDCATELWGNDPQDLMDVPLQGCHYRVRIVDEAGKLNINTATRDQFLGLLDWGMDASVADAIIDWRDADEEPGEEGTEGGYYENLPYRYKIRNGPFKTVRELLMVRGVTEEMFYGTTIATGQGSTRTAASLVSDANATSTSARRGWGEFMTCYTSSAIADTSGVTKVDINQASSQEMQDQLGITAAQAQAIIDNRPSSGYTSIGDLLGGSSTTSTTGTTASQSTVMTTNAANAAATTTTPAVLDTPTFRNIIDLITVGTQQGGTTGTTAATGTTAGGSATTGGNTGGSQTTAGGSSSDASATGATTAATTATSASSAAKTKININTAPVEVLVALWGGTDLAYDLAYNVVSYRDSTLLGIQSLGELLDVPSMTTDAFKQILDQVTLQSNLYSITSVATADQTGISGATWVVEAVIDRGQSPAKILYWYEGACP
jgi:type II secretory pathway component PulK